jgi:hypothetical protein
MHPHPYGQLGGPGGGMPLTPTTFPMQQQQLLQSPSPMTGPTYSATQGRLARGTHRCRMLLAARLGAGAVQGGGRGQDVAAGGNSSSSSRGSGGQSGIKHPSQPQPARSLPPYDRQPCRQCTQMQEMSQCMLLLIYLCTNPRVQTGFRKLRQGQARQPPPTRVLLGCTLTQNGAQREVPQFGGARARRASPCLGGSKHEGPFLHSK